MSVAPKITEFMANLSKDLIEKKGVTESTALQYVKTLYVLNDKMPFKTLSFLRNTETIEEKVKQYAQSTQKSILASIVSVLTLINEKPTYKSVYKHYYELMMGKAKEAKETDTTEKTEKQKENWMNWTEIRATADKLREEAVKASAKKTVSVGEYAALLNALVLGLYVYTQPRRNQDYLDMLVVKKWNENMPKDKNYLDLSGQRFVFNKYKTAKKYGAQIIEIPNTETQPLMDTILMYLKFQPLFKASKGKEAVPFLVSGDGHPLSAVNAITRVLNRIFGKRVGSSMLRHIFLSDKYDVSEMKEDAEAMGHSMAEQRNYLRVNDDV
jgi:hypothetical protein